MAAPGAHHGPDFAGAAAALGAGPTASERLQQLDEQQRQLNEQRRRMAKDIENERRKKARLMEMAQQKKDGQEVKTKKPQVSCFAAARSSAKTLS